MTSPTIFGKAIVAALPTRVTEWRLIEHPLFTVDTWHGVEVITPGVELTDEEKATIRSLINTHISLLEQAGGYREIRFSSSRVGEP